jgi:hypothetical protein
MLLLSTLRVIWDFGQVLAALLLRTCLMEAGNDEWGAQFLVSWQLIRQTGLTIPDGR